MTGSTAALRRNSRLIFGVTPRFWPEMKTLNFSRAARCGPGIPCKYGDLQEKPAGMSDLEFHMLKEAAESLNFIFCSRRAACLNQY